MECEHLSTKIIDSVRVVSNTTVVVSVSEIRLKISIDDFGREKYKKGQILNEISWQKLMKQSVVFLARNYSFRLLSYSAKSEVEIKRKIENKISDWLYKNKIAIDKNIVDEVVSSNLVFLKQKGFIDDKAYVESVLRRYKNKSRKELYFKLIGNGVDKEIINKYLGSFDDREKMAIRAYVVKKTRGKTKFSGDEKRKLLLSLYRRGFSVSLAKIEIDDLIQNK